MVNKIVVVRDGVEALDFLFGTWAYEGCDTRVRLQVVLLDLKLRKIDGPEVLKRVRAAPGPSCCRWSSSPHRKRSRI
jgi:two-component system response regulator